jgi:hypothetical protein
MMTCTICVAPGAMNPVLGFTQYFFGAVVFTLNASSAAVGLYRRIVVGICFFSSTGFLFHATGTGRTRVSRATERGESAGGGDRTRDARAVSRREPSPRDGSPGTSGTQMPFSDARGDETRPEGCQNARRAIRDGRRAGTHVET